MALSRHGFNTLPARANGWARHYVGSPKEGWEKPTRETAWRKWDWSCIWDSLEHHGRENWGAVPVGGGTE